MRHYSMRNGIMAFIGAVIFALPMAAEKAALAQPVDEVAGMGQPTEPLRPGETLPGFVLPPLSDHLNVAALSDDEVALEDDDASTAEIPSQRYDNEPAEIEVVMLIPPVDSATDISETGEDGTARQYDRGYYKEPEVIVALIIVTAEDEDMEE